MENESYRIMVVDDEVTARVSLGEVLRLQGYDVILAESGEDALKQITTQPPFDLMIVDLKMPGMDGLQLTISVQERSPETVIILLTAFGSLETAIEAIRRGAHDYLLKPCPIPQILESVRKGLVKRRQEQQRKGLVVRLEQTLNELVAVERGEEVDFSVVEPTENTLHVREVELNRDRHSVEVNGEPVNLTPTEFKLLACMMERPDQVCSPQELIRNAQGYEADPWGARAIVRVHIRRLRRKLEPDPVHPTYIINVRGVGYMFPSEPPSDEEEDDEEEDEDAV